MIQKSDFDTPGDALSRPHANCYWLLPARVLAGEHPARGGPAGLAERLQALQLTGVTHFIDLTDDQDRLPAYTPMATAHLKHPIVDFGVPSVADLRATLDDVAAALASGGVVYLHCKAGVGRTGTVAACLLVEHGYTADQALALLARKWHVAGQRVDSPHTPETLAQRAFVGAWAARSV